MYVLYFIYLYIIYVCLYIYTYMCLCLYILDIRFSSGGGVCNYILYTYLYSVFYPPLLVSCANKTMLFWMFINFEAPRASTTGVY